jgi:catechol 2,3-dioxygenase-like lactoylglutathione lyase family enzyme
MLGIIHKDRTRYTYTMLQDLPAFSGYSVTNREAALKFYRDVLQLPVTETAEGLQLDLKGCSVFLYEKADHVPATFTVLNFVVKDIDDAVDELVAKGITFDRYDIGPMEGDEKNIYRGRAIGRGPDIAWFKDPAENILSVIQPK